jgi:hypothetical protein
VTEEAVVPDLGAYCREIEAYLCRRNGGHLIRIVGPAFDTVSGWNRTGIPLRLVFRGIDRFVERQQARPGRHRPARVEFCEADVLSVFDDWKRAVGPAGATIARAADRDSRAATPEGSRGTSLPAHLQRVQVKLTSLLAGGRWPPSLAAVMDAVVRRLDDLRAGARHVRGEDRARLLSELSALDGVLIEAAWATQEAPAQAELRRQGAADLTHFRDRMTGDAWHESVEAAARRVLRERLGLPTLTLM